MSKDLRRGLRERDKRIKNNLLKDMKKAVYPKGDFYLTSEGERLIPYYRKRNIALNKHLDNLKDKPVKVELGEIEKIKGIYYGGAYQMTTEAAKINEIIDVLNKLVKSIKGGEKQYG